MYDILIIGGGAAGMLCAVIAAKNGARAAILERNDRLGKKLAITGKGRCNICNNSDNDTIMKNIPRNARFLYSALSQFSAADVMELFESLGVALKTERGNRVFPQSDKAVDVVQALKKEISRLKVEVIFEQCTELIIEDGVCLGARTKKREVRAAATVLATGGKSYPLTGSDGFGYTLAQQAGHTIITPEPSLSAMVTKEKPLEAAGLDLRNISMRLFDGEKCIYEDFGELYLMNYGISGPTVLSASAHIPKMEQGRYSVRIDLKPALTEKQLDARILRDFNERRGQRFADSLRGLLPAQLVAMIVRNSGIDADKKVDEISRAERAALLKALKELSFTVTGFRPIDEAIVTRGGVSVKEISPKTMGSKLCRGLYFAGEIIDCDGYTGGFNLQIAFSTGYAAAVAAFR